MDLLAGYGKESMTESELQEAILEHAKFLGMDPVLDAAFLWIAEESLTAPLPKGWVVAEADDGSLYHFNPDTGESLWEHPLDEVYRQKFRDREEKAKAPTREEIQEMFVRAGMSDRTARLAREKVFTFDGVDWTESDLAQAVTHEEGAHFFLRVLEILEIPGVDIHVKRGILTDKFWKAETPLVALYNFDKKEENDLSFKKGELLIGHELEGDWWVGSNEAGETGVFPVNFVKRRKKTLTTAAAAAAAAAPADDDAGRILLLTALN